MYADKFEATRRAFKSDIAAAGLAPDVQHELVSQLEGYAGYFRTYVALAGEIRAGVTEYSKATGAIEPVLDQLSVSAFANAMATRDRVHASAQAGELTTVTVSLGALLLGVVVALLIARRISRSVSDCLDFSTRVARGDFAARIDSGGSKEFATLAMALNGMTGALQEREAGLQRAQSMARLGHIVTGPDGSFESWSVALERILGFDAARMPRTTRAWVEIVHPEDRAMFRGRCLHASRQHARADVNYRVQRPDGVWIELLQVMEPLEQASEAGQQGRWFNTIQDVTEQAEQQRKIARLTRLYSVLSGINAAIVRIHERTELLEQVCRIAVEEGAFRMAWIGLLDTDSLDGSIVAWYGGSKQRLEKIHFSARADAKESEQPACVAVREKRPVVCNDVAADPAMAGCRAELIAESHRALAAFPLIVADRVIGVIALAAGEAGFFDAQELSFLGDPAGDIGFGLEFIGKEEQLNYLAYYDALTALSAQGRFTDWPRQRRRSTAAMASSRAREHRSGPVHPACRRNWPDCSGRRVGAQHSMQASTDLACRRFQRPVSCGQPVGAPISPLRHCASRSRRAGPIRPEAAMSRARADGEPSDQRHRFRPAVGVDSCGRSRRWASVFCWMTSAPVFQPKLFEALSL